MYLSISISIKFVDSTSNYIVNHTNQLNESGTGENVWKKPGILAVGINL